MDLRVNYVGHHIIMSLDTAVDINAQIAALEARKQALNQQMEALNATLNSLYQAEAVYTQMATNTTMQAIIGGLLARHGVAESTIAGIFQASTQG